MTPCQSRSGCRRNNIPSARAGFSKKSATSSDICGPNPSRAAIAALSPRARVIESGSDARCWGIVSITLSGQVVEEGEEGLLDPAPVAGAGTGKGGSFFTLSFVELKILSLAGGALVGSLRRYCSVKILPLEAGASDSDVWTLGLSAPPPAAPSRWALALRSHSARTSKAFLSLGEVAGAGAVVGLGLASGEGLPDSLLGAGGGVDGGRSGSRCC
ncbi:MAG: hypothetical protein K6U11_13875 [bacterium]|nr:hypothetical protein [bacterium]